MEPKMENQEKMIKNMNKILISDLNLKNLDVNIIKKNVEKVSDKLKELDIKNDRHKYLCLSCIYSAFLGDSMGSCCEFSQPSPENHCDIFAYTSGIFDPGEVTDDSEMAISSAFAYMDILNENPQMIQDIIYYYFCVWRCSGPKDIGNATSTALRFWREESIEEAKFNYQMVRASNWGSLANGFLMRISTFIAYYYYTHLDSIYNIISKYFNDDQDKKEISGDLILLYMDIYQESSKNTSITHPNFENGISSAIFTLMTLTGMVTQNAGKVYSLFKDIVHSPKFFDCHTEKYVNLIAKETQKKYLKILEEVESEKISPVFQMMGYYIHGFKLSVYYIKKLAEMGDKLEDDIYYKIMCNVCDFGGDTDTNCAIVGAMIGPLIGYKNFNDKYFDTFINFVPKQRSQFNSAFMYIYVNYLEEKLKQSKEDVKKSENDTNLPDTQKEKGQFKYTAFKKIMEFLTTEINI